MTSIRCSRRTCRLIGRRDDLNAMSTSVLLRLTDMARTSRLLSCLRGDISVWTGACHARLRLAHSHTAATNVLPSGPDLQFSLSQREESAPETENYPQPWTQPKKMRFAKVFFEIHGCQMNTGDAEVAWSVLRSAGYQKVDRLSKANVVLILTCAIRDSAERKIWERLEDLKHLKEKAPLKIGLLGCMAERLKEKALEKDELVDFVAGPDSYRDLPRLLDTVKTGQKAVNVLLSKEETYADISPVQLSDSRVTAFVSIQRGCDNFCSFCIVPFVRGKERSRPVGSIVAEVENLVAKGVREVTLLGQNVNSYRDASEETVGFYSPPCRNPVPGFSEIYKPKTGGLDFVHLLDQISAISSELRVRFQAAHPKDFPDQVLHLIRDRPNICKQLHLPAQSGSSRILRAMRRGYTREAYMNLVRRIRKIIPEVSFTSDFIAGFCGETEEDHEETLELLREMRYSFVYGFPYSTREGTTAHRRLKDDVPQGTKNRRFMELLHLFRNIAMEVNTDKVGSVQLVLIEGDSKRSSEFVQGRADCGTKVILPKAEVPTGSLTDLNVRPITPGDYIATEVTSASSQVMHGRPLYLSSIREFGSDCLA